jgi:glycosyltransferase involved in cell wall biosynthesis
MEGGEMLGLVSTAGEPSPAPDPAPPARRPLRILHVVAYPQLTRGTAIQAFLLGRQQQGRGHEVSFAFARTSAGANGHRPLQPVTDAGLDLELYAMDSPREMLRFRSMLARSSFDVIHAHYRDVALRFCLLSSVSLGAAGLFASWGNVYPIDRHRWLSLSYREGSGRRAHSAWAGLALRTPRVVRIVAVAEAVKQVVVETGAVPPEKVSVIYEGVDPKVFHPGVDGSSVREEFGIPSTARVVGIASAYYWVKDYPTFLRSAALLGAQYPDVHFLIAGDGTEQIPESLLAETGIRDRIAIAGGRSDMPSVLGAMDVLVSSSRYEALTGSAREALAMAKPVVCTDVGGNSELVRPGETGWLVPPADQHAIAQAVSTVLDEPSAAAAVANAGRARVIEHHTLDARCRAVDALYEQALDGNGR